MIHILHPELKELIDNLQLQIARVRELHKSIYISPNEYVCEYCTDDVGSYRDYPCSTIKALDGEQ
jgi:hypothetical protein